MSFTKGSSWFKRGGSSDSSSPRTSPAGSFNNKRSGHISPPPSLSVAFACADSSGAGCLDADAIHGVLITSGVHPPYERVDALLPRFDSNADGCLTLNETKHLSDYLQSEQPEMLQNRGSIEAPS